jgi:glycosyltransferase involved in cell wall biosynthesis
MRILILNQFYAPDAAPTGQVAHDLARALVARGHTVSALASRRSYSGTAVYPAREILDGVLVQRLAALSFGPKNHVRKLLAYASFYVATAIRLALLRPRPDVVVALTTPPYIGLLARLVGSWRGWRRVHWIMDLYPDVLAAHGMLGWGVGGRLVGAGLRWLTRCEFAGARAVLTLGPDMAARCGCYVRSPERVEWVPLWAAEGLYSADADAVRRLRHERGWDGKLVLLYSGNMGLGHRFGEFLAAAAQSAERGGQRIEGGGSGGESAATSRALEREPAVRSTAVRSAAVRSTAVRSTAVRSTAVRSTFVFAGGGRRRAQIEAFVGAHRGAPVELLPYATAEDLAVHLRSGDVLLASLDPAWVGCMLPSKLQGGFAAGRPVIFVGPRACALARWIEEAGAGWVVDSGDVAGLLAAVQAAGVAEERWRRGAAAQAYARRRFDHSENCRRIAVLIEGG